MTSSARAPIRRLEIERPEGWRSYLMATPSGAAAGKRALVIILHGGGASASQVLGQGFPPSPLSVWLEIAEREQLIVVAPDGGKGMACWNDGLTGIGRNPRTDDVGYIGALIDKAILEDDADARRVYVVGVSKGGLMSFRLASEIAPRLAAFAAVLASMPVKSDYAAPSVALPALIVASTRDPFFPYQGGKFRYMFSLLAPVRSVDESIATWRQLAGLPDTPAVTALPRHDRHERTRATRYTWGADAAQTQVVLLKIDHGGHSEPSRKERYPRLLTWLAGAQDGDLEVAEEAWAFFKDKRIG
ncbi:MAG: hypothetical protein V4463_04205 [Pseudomonadota bacterium]